MNKEYKNYLKSEQWAEIRNDMIEIYDSICQCCFKKIYKTGQLQVHHLTYKNIFNEEPEDLILLCKNCHAKVHGYSVPRRKRLTRKYCTDILRKQFDWKIKHMNCSWRYLANIIEPGFDKKGKYKKFVKNYVKKFKER